MAPMPVVTVVVMTPVVPLLATTFAVVVQCQHLRDFGFVLFEISEQTFIRQVQGTGILPVVVNHLLQALDDRLIVHFDGEFAPAIKASRGKVD
jgi:hypothetical protein